MVEQMKIRILSFDFDGCLFNEKYIESRNKNVIHHNLAFLDKIKEENNAFERVFTFVGSNRQSKLIDDSNAPDKGSCFPALIEVNKYLNATLDKLLLADIYGFPESNDGLPAGTSFDNALNSAVQNRHANWVFDSSKATIIYAQMHKIANAYPDDDIVLDFYDDRGNGSMGISVDILEQLMEFYKSYSTLIPSNVKLRLNHYDGGDVTPMAEIMGTGFIDCDYRQTVRDMAVQADADCYKINPRQMYDVAGKVIVALLDRIPLVSDKADDCIEFDKELQNNGEVSLAKEKFTHALKAIEAKKTAFEGTAKKRRLNNPADTKAVTYDNAALAASVLIASLESAANQFFDEKGSKDDFERAANEAIAVARASELKNHRGCIKEIAGYTGLAILAVLSIATLGTAYVIAGGINYAVNRQFFFATTFNTDSINKVDDMEVVVKAISAPTA